MDRLYQRHRLNRRWLQPARVWGREKFEEIDLIANCGFERELGEDEEIIGAALAHCNGSAPGQEIDFAQVHASETSKTTQVFAASGKVLIDRSASDRLRGVTWASPLRSGPVQTRPPAK